MVGGITNIIITWETNETNIYLLVRAKCVRCNLVVLAKQSSLNTFSPRRGKKMWGVKIWELNFLANGLLAEHIGLSEAYALPYWIK